MVNNINHKVLYRYNNNKIINKNIRKKNNNNCKLLDCDMLAVKNNILLAFAKVLQSVSRKTRTKTKTFKPLDRDAQGEK